MVVSFASSGPHHFVAFREQVSRFEGVWRSIDIRYSAVKVGDDWLNLMTDIRLSPAAAPSPGTEDSEVFVRLPRLIAGRITQDLSQLDQVLQDIESTRLNLDGTPIRLVQPSREGVGTAQNFPFQPFFGEVSPSDGWKPFWDPERESKSFTLLAHGGNLGELVNQDLWRRFEHELLVHSPPYFGLDDLLRYFIRATDPVNTGGSTRLAVRAPVYTWVESQELDEGSNLVTRVRCPLTIQGTDLRLVARAGTDSSVVRFDERGGHAVAADDHNIVTITVPVEGLHWIQGALILRDTRVDDFAFALPRASSANPRYDALYITDVGERRLRQFVEVDNAMTRPELAQVAGLSWLFQLCGFQVLATGLPGFNMGTAPDLLAFVPLAEAVVVVEATTRDLASDGKLVKLRDRADALKERLPRFDVLALAATAKSTVTTPEADLARSLNVRILTQSELEDLRQMAERNESPSRVFARLKSPPR